MGAGETARYWRHPGLAGVDLLRAHYVRHTFGRHTHETYAIGVIEYGVEEWRYGGSLQRAGVGGMPLVNPDMVHTGHAGVPEGWAYRMLYPGIDVVREVATELGLPAGTPWFAEPMVYDAEAARLTSGTHRAAEAGDALASGTLTRLLLSRLLRRYGGGSRLGRPVRSAGQTAAERARDLLESRLADPPDLDALAFAVGARPFSLLRAFRDRYGLPPHAYLTQYRVRRARDLLEAGWPPGRTAAAVGFADQAHLTRHFRRIIGVPPGAYQRETQRETTRQSSRNSQDGRNVQDRSEPLFLP